MKRAGSFLIALFLLTSFTSSSQDSLIKKEKFHFNISQDTSAGYAQAVKVDNIIYISGTVAVDLTEAGVTRLYKTLERTLKHYGASFQNVVKENLFTTDIETMKNLNYVRKQFYNGDFPAASWVQVVRLYMIEAKLEVELVAHLPAK